MIKHVFGIVAALAVLAMNATPAATQTNGEKLRITAFAVNMSNIGTGGTATVEFDVDRWSTDADRTALISTMEQKGADALLAKLKDQPSHGRMRFPAWVGPDPLNARLGWDIRYASRKADPRAASASCSRSTVTCRSGKSRTGREPSTIRSRSWRSE